MADAAFPMKIPSCGVGRSDFQQVAFSRDDCRQEQRSLSTSPF